MASAVPPPKCCHTATGSGSTTRAPNGDESFPPATSHSVRADPTVDWGTNTWAYNDVYVLLQAYVKNYKVFYCPDRQRFVPASGDFTKPGPLTFQVWGYGYHWSSGYGAQ